MPAGRRPQQVVVGMAGSSFVGGPGGTGAAKNSRLRTQRSSKQVSSAGLERAKLQLHSAMCLKGQEAAGKCLYLVLAPYRRSGGVLQPVNHHLDESLFSQSIGRRPGRLNGRNKFDDLPYALTAPLLCSAAVMLCMRPGALCADLDSRAAGHPSSDCSGCSGCVVRPCPLLFKLAVCCGRM